MGIICDQQIWGCGEAEAEAVGFSCKGQAPKVVGKGGCLAPQRRWRAGLGSVPADGGEFPREDSFHSLQASEEPKLGTHTSAMVRGKRERP